MGVGVARKRGWTIRVTQTARTRRTLPPITNRYKRTRHGSLVRRSRPSFRRSPVSRITDRPRQPEAEALGRGVEVGSTSPQINSPSVALATAISSSGTPRSKASKIGVASSQRSLLARARPKV